MIADNFSDFVLAYFPFHGEIKVSEVDFKGVLFLVGFSFPKAFFREKITEPYHVIIVFITQNHNSKLLISFLQHQIILVSKHQFHFVVNTCILPKRL